MANASLNSLMISETSVTYLYFVLLLSSMPSQSLDICRPIESSFYQKLCDAFEAVFVSSTLTSTVMNRFVSI